MNADKPKWIADRDKVVDAAAEKCVAHIRKISNGNWFPYEVIEAISGIKRFDMPRLMNKQWKLLVKKIRKLGHSLPQENLAADDRGSFNLITIIDEGFEVPHESKAVVHVGHKWSSQTRGASVRAIKSFKAIQQAKLSDHDNHVLIGSMSQAERQKRAADENARYMAMMLKRDED